MKRLEIKSTRQYSMAISLVTIQGLKILEHYSVEVFKKSGRLESDAKICWPAICCSNFH